MIVSVGRLGDLTGRRRLLVAGIALFTTASALCGLAPTLADADRGPRGTGPRRGDHVALAMALVSEAVPRARTGSAMGLLGTMSAIGTALGPSIGGLLVAALGWRAIFLVPVPVGVAGRAARPSPRRRRPRGAGAPSGPPSTTAARCCSPLTLAVYTLAMTVGGGSFGPLNVALLTAAVVGVVLFTLARAGRDRR